MFSALFISIAAPGIVLQETGEPLKEAPLMYNKGGVGKAIAYDCSRLKHFGKSSIQI